MSSKLKDWFEINGGKLHSDVVLASKTADGKGHGLNLAHGASASSQKEQTVVSLPYGICLSILNTPEVAPWWPVHWIDQQNTTVSTRFLLVEAYIQGEGSRFYPYVSCLPQPTNSKPFETPLYWNEDETNLIQGTNLHQATRTRQEKWRLEFSTAKDLLLDSCSERKDHINLYTYELYCWGATILTSRCFPGRLIKPSGETKTGNAFEDSNFYRRWIEGDPGLSFPVLLPVLDLANHDPSISVTWESTPDCVELNLILPLEDQSEIYNNYGQKSNEELILGYGFDLANNRANHVGLALPVGISPKIEFIKSRQNDSASQASHSTVLSSGIAIGNPEPTIYALRAGIHPLSSPAATPLSMLAMNSRELLVQCAQPTLLPDVSEGRFPTRLKVVCTAQFLAKLGQQYGRIKAYDGSLPDEQIITSSKAFQLGKRYRDNQLQILENGVARCEQTLRMWTASGRILSLEVLATDFLPGDMLKQYRQILHRVVGTRNTGKIQQRGQEDLAFVLWIIFVTRSVMGSDARSLTDIQSPGFVKIAQLQSWVGKLFSGYGKPGSEESEKLREINGICWTEHDQALLVETAATFEKLIRGTNVAGKELPETMSLEFEGEILEVSLAAMVAWAIRVIQEEGVIIPSKAYGTEDDDLTDGEGTEFVLVFEDGDD